LAREIGQRENREKPRHPALQRLIPEFCNRYGTVEEGNFEHLFNFELEADFKKCQIFFHNFFLLRGQTKNSTRDHKTI
jgi:hypothetical protein